MQYSIIIFKLFFVYVLKLKNYVAPIKTIVKVKQTQFSCKEEFFRPTKTDLERFLTRANKNTHSAPSQQQ